MQAIPQTRRLALMQDGSTRFAIPISNKLLWYVEWFMDRIRSIPEFENEMHK